MAYYSPTMSASSPRRDAPTSPVLGSRALEEPPTPPSVSNLSPSVCLSLVEFRELMRDYRKLDDGVVTRMNRLMARSRDSGLSSSPSLLSSQHGRSGTAADIGTSTYSTAPQAVCLTFWTELMRVWSGREAAARYCLDVAEHELARRRLAAQAAAVEPGLDADASSSSSLSSSSSSSGSGGRWSRARDTFDDRKSRGEAQDEFTLRQLHNELAVESIIRKRSLDVFRARCRTFIPNFPPGAEGERARAMWEGRDTPAAQQSREQARTL